MGMYHNNRSINPSLQHTTEQSEWRRRIRLRHKGESRRRCSTADRQLGLGDSGRDTSGLLSAPQGRAVLACSHTQCGPGARGQPLSDCWAQPFQGALNSDSFVGKHRFARRWNNVTRQQKSPWKTTLPARRSLSAELLDYTNCKCISKSPA